MWVEVFRFIIMHAFDGRTDRQTAFESKTGRMLLQWHSKSWDKMGHNTRVPIQQGGRIREVHFISQLGSLRQHCQLNLTLKCNPLHCTVPPRANAPPSCHSSYSNSFTAKIRIDGKPCEIPYHNVVY